MQTAIDWYFDKIKSHFEHDGDLLETATFTYAIAKQKEKQQILDAYWGGLNGSINDYSESKQVGSEIIDIKYGKGAEQYYNETYGSKGSDDHIVDTNEMVCKDEDCKHCAEDIAQMQDDETYKVWECCGMEECICKGSDECYFEPKTNTSSATICKHCGREKFMHTELQQINQDNPVTRGSTALVPTPLQEDDPFKTQMNMFKNFATSSQTEISDAGKDTADYIDRHIIESMKELAREGFKPQISEISDEEIEAQALTFAKEESYGELNSDLWKGYVFGAKRMRDQLKQL